MGKLDKLFDLLLIGTTVTKGIIDSRKESKSTKPPTKSSPQKKKAKKPPSQG